MSRLIAGSWSHFGLAMFLVVGSIGFCCAQETDSAATSRARAFLGGRAMGTYILSFVHLGATFRGQTFVKQVPVYGVDNRQIAGEFALIFDLGWDANGGGSTRIAYVCDRTGRVTDVQVQSTTAVLQQPFAFADATIQIVGTALIESFRDRMSADDIRQAETLVRTANSEGLLEMGIALRQVVGIR